MPSNMAFDVLALAKQAQDHARAEDYAAAQESVNQMLHAANAIGSAEAVCTAHALQGDVLARLAFAEQLRCLVDRVVARAGDESVPRNAGWVEWALSFAQRLEEDALTSVPVVGQAE